MDISGAICSLELWLQDLRVEWEENWLAKRVRVGAGVGRRVGGCVGEGGATGERERSQRDKGRLKRLVGRVGREKVRGNEGQKEGVG